VQKEQEEFAAQKTHKLSATSFQVSAKEKAES
jgi:hypothetical protein